MGEIHLARLAGEGGFEKLVVVKRLLPELVASEQFVAMFLDEARIAARLSHPNVCEVYELGRDGATYYLAMQYLEGVSLADLIARPREADRARELRLAAGLIVQAAEGLHHAHEARGADGAPLGLVHRDVSPSNLFVTTDGVVKVLDFGIAKARGASARTEVGTIKGKYAYMSPEQVRGDELDRRSDVFALGICLYELATHQRLFKRPSDFLSAKAILEEPIPRADAVDPAVPRALADVIARALERDPAARYPTARALAAAVASAVPPMSGAELAARIAEDHASDLSAQRTRQQRILSEYRTARTVDLRRGARSRRRWPLLLLAAPAAVAAAVLAITQVQGTTAPPPPDAAVTVSYTVTPDAAAAVTVYDTVTVDAGVREPDAPDARRAEPARAARHGYVSVDSTPYATIFVDGKKVGVTPLIRAPVPAGRRRIRAVLASGAEQRRTVEVAPGRLAPPINFVW